jgi:DNA-binding NarL/FixJ family response regulator
VSVAVIDTSRLFAEAMALTLVSVGITATDLQANGDVSGFDIALVDSRLPAESLTMIAARVAQSTSCRLVLLSPRITKATRNVIRECGAATAVERSADVDELIETLRQVAAGTDVAVPCADQADTGPMSLTCRELEVLGLIAVGATNESVATELGISPHTVRSHLGNILGKLNVTGRLGAVTLVREAALLPEPRRPQVSH